MPASLQGLASDLSIPAARRSAAVPLFLAGCALVLGAAVLAGGGSSEDRLAWIGGAAMVVAAAGGIAAAAGALPVPRLGRSGVALAALLAASVTWSAVTIAWSIEPDRSWAVLNRGLAYLALFALGLLAGAALARAPTAVAGFLAVVCGLAVLWALAGKVVPALGPDLERVARLRAPVGYWNALALLVALSLPLWLWLAAPPGRRGAVRAAAVSLLALSLVALALTASRGGILVAVVAVAVWLALARPRLESAAALVLAGVPAAAVAAWALSRAALTDAGVARGERVEEGVILGFLLVIAAGIAGGATLVAVRRPPLAPQARRRLGLVLAVGAAAVSIAALAGATAALGGPRELLREFRDPGAQVNDPSRFASVSSNNRWTWWTEAWTIWKDNAVGGTGAGTFAVARKPLREGPDSPIEPHNVALRSLSETGAVGFVLLVGVLVAGAAVAAGALRRLSGDDRPAAVALVAGAAAFVAHSLLDMGLEFVAVSAPTLVTLGVLASAGRPRGDGGSRSLFPALAAAGLALAALASLASPRLAERRVDEAVEALAARDARKAVSLAEDAQKLNPLAVRPLHVEAAGQQALGRLVEAERLYVEAVELQPENPETWYQLGYFELRVVGDASAALPALDRSWGLDAFGGAQHLLEEARAKAARQP